MSGDLPSKRASGRLPRWERHYAYAVKPLVTGPYGLEYHWYDYGRIFIDLREAGFDEFRGGRHIHDKRLPYRGWADDRSYDLASGVYDIGADRITFSHCGPNV